MFAAAKLKKIVLLLYLSAVFSGCKPNIIDITNVKIERQGIKIDMQIKNPNFFTITLSDINMDLYVDDYKFENISYKPQIRLAPFSKKYYPLVIDVKPLEHPMASSGALLSLITQDSTLIKMDGDVCVKTFFGKKRFPFSEKIYIKYNQ